MLSDRESKIRLCALRLKYRRAWRDRNISSCRIAELLLKLEDAATACPPEKETSHVSR